MNLSDDQTLTRVDTIGIAGKRVYLKREDLFVIGKVNGPKARVVDDLIRRTEARGLTTASLRTSTQAPVVAEVAKAHDIPCVIRIPSGRDTPETLAAKASGANLIVTRPGHGVVMNHRAALDAMEMGFSHVPYMLDFQQAVNLTAHQVRNLPEDVKRVVMVVGSGITLAGVLTGLSWFNSDFYRVKVLAIYTGSNPTRRLDKYVKGWRTRTTLIEKPKDATSFPAIGNIKLDAHYEAFGVSYLQDRDCLWIAGRRNV